ncbi:MAG: TIGR00730 family Rossman fold protein [Candidatus Parabeggiatoa sp.]|nr:TIGR00730 family Rossman fold protein [Candidatus Parabeggiatoa sp.]
MMKRICVFLGSDLGVQTEYQSSVKQLAKEIVERDIELVYGAAKVGLMGVLADAVLELGGRVIGVVPKGLTQKEIVHDGLTELRVVSSMHERKAQMAELASGFITLPGGIGTLEETCEILTWAQVGIHKKPCGLLNVCGYYDHLIAHLDNMVDQGFFRAVHRSLLIVKEDPKQLLDSLESYQSPDFKRWMKESES